VCLSKRKASYAKPGGTGLGVAAANRDQPCRSRHRVLPGPARMRTGAAACSSPGDLLWPRRSRQLSARVSSALAHRLQEHDGQVTFGEVAVLVEAGGLRRAKSVQNASFSAASARRAFTVWRAPSARTSAVGYACRFSHHAGTRSLPAFEASTAKASPYRTYPTRRRATLPGLRPTVPIALLNRHARQQRRAWRVRRRPVHRFSRRGPLPASLRAGTSGWEH
jgi:hypothetical protein